MDDSTARFSSNPQHIIEVPDDVGLVSQTITETGSGSVFKVVMIRSGCFLWNSKNTYCGWYDSKLSPKGRQEIQEASILLKNENYTFDLAFCSALSRCKESLSIILNELELNDIEVITSWKLNERHFGGLTGYNKDEIFAKYGREQVNFWLNSYTQRPPEMTTAHKYYNDIYSNEFLPKNRGIPTTESLEMMQNRTKDFWNKQVCPKVLSVTNDLERKIVDAFDVFDHGGNRTVDMREIGTIIRSLGCVPTEAEIQEILVATEDPEAKGVTGSIHLANFLPYMVRQLIEHKYQPATPDQLLEAFRKIDTEGVGYVTKEQFTTLMTQEGEPFTEDETEEMLSIALDPQSQTIPYEYYINQIMFETSHEKNIYTLADQAKALIPRRSVRTASAIFRAALEMADASGDDLLGGGA